METPKIFESEYRFCEILWDNEPVSSSELVRLCNEKLEWNNTNIAWTVVCILGGAAYNALMAWAHGGSHYEMLVSGNVKRMSAEQFEGGYKMSSHKEAKEYRIWKGFAIG